MKEAKTENYDLVIIGAGGTGLAAAMYAARLNLKTLVLGTMSSSELPVGGVITTTNLVENYPGFPKTSGLMLARKLEEHARGYEEVTIKVEKADSVERLKTCFVTNTSKGRYKSKTIIFATGTKWRKLDVPGAKEYEGRGVNYCALCDGPLYKNKIVAVVGGSDSAAKDALLLAEHAKKVYIIYRGDEIHPEPINLERIQQNKKIEVITNTNLTKIGHENHVTQIELDKKYNGKNTLDLDGVFVAIGHIALSDLAKSIGVKVDKKGEIIIDHKDCSTNIKGAYAAGDVTDKPFKQLITGVADGCVAAHSAYEYITNEHVLTCSDE